MQKIIKFIKEHEWLYRGLRTFIEAFISALAISLMGGLEDFSKKTVTSVFVGALSSGIAALLNITPKNTPTLPSEFEEKTEDEGNDD